MDKHLLIIAALIFSGSVVAQTTNNPNVDAKSQDSSNNAPKITVGLKVSPAVSWVKVIDNDMKSDGASLKLGVGLVLNYELLPNISLVSGLNYNKLGSYVYDNNSLNNSVYKKNYQSVYGEIELPVALKLKTNPVREMSYFLQGGFSVGFIVNATEIRIPISSNSEPNYRDISQLTNPARLNYLLGAGVDYFIGKRTYLFGLISYKNSFTNLANSNAYMENGHSTAVQIYPGSIDFSVGIMF